MSVVVWPDVLGAMRQSTALRDSINQICQSLHRGNSEAKYGYPMRHMDILAM
jgi:hypothetical protein